MGPELRLLEPPANAQESCYIDTAIGVTSVLRAIADAGTRAAAYIDEETCIHTTLLAVEGEPPMVVFEKGGDPELNSRLERATVVTFVTSDQGVPVQFSCPDPEPCDYELRTAFQVCLPPRVLRLQRRSYYRLPGEPIHVDLKCQLVCDVTHENATLRPCVLDLSCGGLAAAVAMGGPELEKDDRAECSLELPTLGKIEATVQVRAASDMLLPGGEPGRRYGLEFLNLSGKSIALVQRFILEQQRNRKKFAKL